MTMLTTQEKKLPILWKFARVIELIWTCIFYIGLYLFFKMGFLELTNESGDRSLYGVFSKFLFSHFFIFCGLSVTKLAEVLLKIAIDPYGFFLNNYDVKKKMSNLSESFAASSFFVFFYVLCILFVPSVDVKMMVVFSVTCCTNLYCLNTIFYYRNEMNKLLNIPK